jgi:hypothetical protein
MELNNIAASVYKCGYCNKEYKLKQNYDRHSISCELYYKTNYEKKEDKEKVPTVKELYAIILDMSVKCSKLEKKVEELTKWNASKKKKLNIIEWLNEKYSHDGSNSNSKTFSNWLNTIQISRIHLEKVFKSDYINSIVEIIYELSNANIKAFDQKENVLFIYDNENNENDNGYVNIKKEKEEIKNTWKVMSSDTFIRLINLINKKLLNEFVNWQKENKYRMYEDEFSSIYTANVKKITCMHMSQDQIQNKIKKDLYKAIKMNLQNIVEYEFSF